LYIAHATVYRKRFNVEVFKPMTYRHVKPVLGLVALAAVVAVSGCATKKYVRQRIDERVAPVEGRTGELEETSRRNSADIQRLSTEVADARTRADQAQASADRAQTSADTARTTAVEATNRADTVNRRVDTLVENIDAYELSRTVTIAFKLSQSMLDDEDRAALDALAAELAGKKGYVLDIQGYTDTSGSLQRNIALSDRRARAVYQYLAEKGVPLHRMNLLGFGEAQPVGDNTTRDGRAENRRVEVRVMTTKLQN
jgi:outer membrane protein OmpA-like peptidoglycan-associated protein